MGAHPAGDLGGGGGGGGSCSSSHEPCCTQLQRLHMHRGMLGTLLLQLAGRQRLPEQPAGQCQRVRVPVWCSYAFQVSSLTCCPSQGRCSKQAQAESGAQPWTRACCGRRSCSGRSQGSSAAVSAGSQSLSRPDLRVVVRACTASCCGNQMGKGIVTCYVLASFTMTAGLPTSRLPVRPTCQHLLC